MSSFEYQDPKNNTQMNSVFDSLTAVDQDLKKQFINYIHEEYNDNLASRLYYIDMAEISRFVVKQFKLKQDKFLKDFFTQVEHLLTSCDSEIENLIVLGLLEGIQNIGGTEIDYHYGYNKWLLPISKTKWDSLIDFWEGTEWRNKKPTL